MRASLQSFHSHAAFGLQRPQEPQAGREAVRCDSKWACTALWALATCSGGSVGGGQASLSQLCLLPAARPLCMRVDLSPGVCVPEREDTGVCVPRTLPSSE